MPSRSSPSIIPACHNFLINLNCKNCITFFSLTFHFSMDGWWFNGQRHQWQSRWVWSHLYRQCTRHVASFHLVGYIHMSLQQFRGCSCRSLRLWLPCLSLRVLGGRFACSWREILDIFWGISRFFFTHAKL